MKNSIWIPILLLLLVNCEQPTEFDRTNTKDPLSDAFYPDPMSNIQLQITENHARINWDRGSEFTRGYQIIKSDVNNTIISEEFVDDKTTSFIDTSLSPFNGYYQINPVTQHETVIQEMNRIHFEYNISDLQSSYQSSNNSVLLGWDFNGYFDTHFNVSRTTQNGTVDLGKRIIKSPYQFEIGQFDYNVIGLNTFEIFPETSIGIGETVSTSIRLPQWEGKQALPADIKGSSRLLSIGSVIYAFRSPYQNYKFDMLSNSWAPIAPSVTLITSFTIQAISPEEILLISGSGYEIYNITQDTWDVYSDFPYPRLYSFGSAAISEDHVLLAGGSGSNRNQRFKTSYLFDTATRTWRQTADMLSARDGHKIIKIDKGRAIVYGGFPHVYRVELFDISMEEWLPMPDCPIMPNKAVQLENGSILVLSDDSSVLFNTSTLTWSEPVRFDGEQFAADTNDISLVALPDGNALVNGLTYSRKGRFVRAERSQIFDLREEKWIQIGNTLDERVGSYSFISPDNNIVTIGGSFSPGSGTYEFLNISDFLQD